MTALLPEKTADNLYSISTERIGAPKLYGGYIRYDVAKGRRFNSVVPDVNIVSVVTDKDLVAVLSVAWLLSNVAYAFQPKIKKEIN